MSTITPEHPEMAQQAQKANRLHEASILKRANPQLQNAVHLALTTPHADQQGYNSKFGGRASQYVAPGAVASMFSPAAYLTELYRQARDLHAENSIYHLDKRRPDLKSLTLSQQNMDDEVSTLSLSNKVLLEGIKAQAGLEGHTNVMKALSTFRSSGSLPYHDAYESVRKVIQLQAPIFEQFNTSPETTIANLTYHASLLGINASVLPELFNTLTEEITEANANEKFKKNFGDREPSELLTLDALKHYYNLTDEELEQFLNHVLIESNSTYTNNQLINISIDTSGKIQLSRITRTPDSNYNNLNYMKLYPIQNRRFYVDISYKKKAGQVSIRLSKPQSKYLTGIYKATIENTNYSSPTFELTDKDIQKEFTLLSYRYKENSDSNISDSSYAKFKIQDYSPAIFLLKLNKTIRLSHATKLLPTVLEKIVFNINQKLDINAEILKKIFRVKYYMQRYGIDAETALVLCKVSTNIINPSSSDLIKLLANIHQLTVNELNLLLIAIGEGSTNLSGISDNDLSILIDKLYSVTQWLRTQNLNIYLLFMMTTTDYNKTLTPEIQNLLDAVYNGLQGFNNGEDASDLLLKMSPYITAALQLPSENAAHYVLIWADQLKPGNGKMTATKFWEWLQALHNPEQSTAVTEEQAVQYCQCLAQLALIYRSIGLSESTLRLFVTKPQLFSIKVGTAPTHDTSSLIMLTRFTDWVNSLSEKASSVLTEFEKGTLEAKQLADAMNLDKNLLEQASNQAQVNFANWPSIDTIQQWINIARQLNISPQHVSALAQVLTTESSDNYAEWENVAATLTAGLDTQKANALHTFLDESRSTALSAYYIANKDKDAEIKNRDDLYQYLLIDNQVSTAIKTTPIAEAIASIQLYINRALKNMEGNAVSQVVTRPFFTDWDKYNKRYSTWAGITKLVYYPENYIDPTIRIGRTKMMDTLLQSISQSQLNTDTVEDAFMSYLTSFEQVANLEIISAYHDNINSDQGLTYFIGHSKTEVNQYYWRSVDHNKFSDGKFPANAWNEWHKIDCPINPYKSTIRPVIFQSRLHLIWLEQKKIAKQADNNQTVEDYHYELKLTHIRYDSTWNTPITFDVSDKVSAVLKMSNLPATLELLESPESLKLGFYCINHQNKDKLLVMFYRKQDELDEYKRKVEELAEAEKKVKEIAKKIDSEDGISVSDHQEEQTAEKKLKELIQELMQGLYISSNMLFENIEPEQHRTIYELTYSQFDTNNVIRVNNQYVAKYEIPPSVDQNNSYLWEAKYFCMVSGGNIQDIKYKVTPAGLKIQISPRLKIIHNWDEKQLSNKYPLKGGNRGNRDQLFNEDKIKARLRNQYNLIKKYGKLGDKFIAYTSLKVNPDKFSLSNELMFYPVYQYSGNASGLHQGRLLFHRDTNYSSNVAAWIPEAGRSLNKDNAAIGDDYAEDSLNKPNDLKQYIMTDSRGIATDVSGPVDINTAISPTQVQVTVKTGSKEKTFTADKDVSVQPSPNFEEMYYQFNSLEIDVPEQAFNNNKVDIDVTFKVSAIVFEEEDEHTLGEEHFNISITRKVNNDNILTIHNDTNGAQYMQSGAYRIRLNTLFARKLISRATAGIDTILSIETQKLPEPQLGEGFFTNLILPKYDQTVHGNERWFKIHTRNDNRLMNLYHKGTLTDTETNVTLFIPWTNTQKRVEIAVKYNKKFYQDQQNWETALFHFNETNQKFMLVNDADNKQVVINDTDAIVNKYKGFLDVSILIDQHTEPMDFNGANSLYFWELFYYAPMLIAQRLLHEQNFDEANRWLKYIWNPSGYIKHGQIHHDHWNVRPLLEDTRWNDDPLDSVDPDAIAQYDPMHYKVVTFMRTLDLLLDRGDYAYRQLERDTLNEAKMWYMQALHLLGDKPHLSFSSTWRKPSLGDAARTEKQEEHAQAMTALRQGDISRHNHPTDLFLPQVNEVMQNYWQKLEQRLYNLRHNLSIDGQLLHLPIYATPADPKALLSAAVANSQGGSKLPTSFMSLWRFPQMLENARGMVSQLTQFGSTLQNIIERQDTEALNTLLQNQAAELILTNLSIQDKTLEELDAEKIVLEKSKAGAQSRFNSYKKLYDENINAGENRVIALHASVAGLSTALQASRLAGAALDLAPNIFGFADGGSRWGAIAEATGNVMEFSASVMNTEADKISQSEAYRRRRQEWKIQRNNAEAEIKQIDAQLQSLAVRRGAAVLQKTSLKTQQEQTQAQLTFLQRKFSNQTLYHWLRGRLAAIYFQFYDLAVTRCLMAEMAYRWETHNTTASFIKPGAWQGTHAGLLAGETLMLNLAQMEDAYLRWDQRALEVERTISLAQLYGTLPEKSFNLATRISALLTGSTTEPVDAHPVTLENSQLSAKISLSGLSLHNDYPEGNGVGNIRRIKQISVTLPALLGPYQDVQAILAYSESETGLAESCKSLAISHGMNDSGQFQLDFNNGKFLPFEGIAINDTGTLTLNFPNATGKQQVMLQALSDIILHIRYTIRQ
ncbi:neuraminidase-like domain-containing protein [Photorhabdus aegyptia]|uniref:Tc toxin subunit A-related protein n=1 Tax=Photorhabdus aegyptia TaxID=2805098 RepID=UPI001E3CA55D|nr:neuraminidase-like domain-containing protein [Photorhabdus aegyptia]MCC8458171.1 toxin [Photorhabdus aegyptia]